MKLEVGKWYKDSMGSVVKIIGMFEGFFAGNNDRAYNWLGLAVSLTAISLTEEVPELSLGDWRINEGRVPDADVTAVMFRAGNIGACSVYGRDGLDWVLGGGDSDIVAYCTSPFENVTCSSNEIYPDISELDQAAGKVPIRPIFTIEPGSTIEFMLPPDIDMTEPGYETLADVLQRAYDQAAKGKGKERHAQAGEPFDEQVMQQGAQRFGVGALLFQAFKKSEESQRLPHDAAIKELLGGIVYLAGAVIALEKGKAS